MAIDPERSDSNRRSATAAIDSDQLAYAQLEAMASGDPVAAARCIHPDNINHMAADEPAACARPGVPGFLATSAWLRLAFSDLRFELIDSATNRDLTIAHVWMRGRQVGPFVVFPPGAKPVAFPPTGREFAVRQCHVFRVRDGLYVEHTAVRDDLGMMTQLGHLPPSPAAMLRMARWNLTGRAARAISTATRTAASAADAAIATPVRG